MKFSHSIQFNAVPDWSTHYIAYSNLKKLIYTLEKKYVQSQAKRGSDDAERAALLDDDVDTDGVFRKALDAELDKISKFYAKKERELLDEVEQLLQDANEYDDGRGDLELNPDDARLKNSGVGPSFSTWGNQRDLEADGDGDGSDDSDEDASGAGGRLLNRSARHMHHSITSDAPSDHQAGRRRYSTAASEEGEQAMNTFHDKRITLKKRAISLFVALRELKSFSQLNRTGFTKALKKYDKILQRNLKSRYVEQAVAPAHCFQASTIQHLDENVAKVEATYANLVTQGDLEEAKKELRLHLREHVVWERNTVWRDMIGIERKAHAAHLGLTGPLLGDQVEKKRLAGDEVRGPTTKNLKTPFGSLTVPTWLFSGGFFTLTAIILVFAVLLQVKTFKTPEQQNCFAMLVFVSLLWATEVIPLFVTSLLIPFLVVLLRIVRHDQKPHTRMETKEATKYIFSAMWTPVIMLLLGGFAIAAALSKYGIAKRMATFVLAKAGTRPRTVLLTNMFVAMFASMWISNVAAPVLCFSIIQPLLRNLPSNSDFSKALILGIALSSNIGGMASPIASPQNIIALENMHPAPSWGAWFFVALPVCIISILLIWVLLLISFRPGKGTTIVPIRTVKDPFTGVEWFIMIVTLATIILWCGSHALEHIFGDMGVIAIIPLVLFFGTGILSKEDFNNFLWTIIILAAGGLSLGKAVNSSGLLHTIAQSIKERVDGYSLYAVLCVFCGLILVIATFISHTVAALIVLPIVMRVGAAMDEPHPNLLVMGAALMCSAAMGLPTSGFPNMTAIMLEDSQTGERYLGVKHFITRGVPSSFIAFFVVITVGFGLMRVAGF
ncbi:SPX domain-containing protein [Tricharina praecox]|uniref:SPX domain-containing protein n=1 Tax=Tricharina praecox TaxID=43433 RepID=UPI00221F50D8|nr:SPX domain-containing protein [Tricharina praecox]KAI5856070.1 SPX domain-containing protein [Tricharina praecox]